MLDRVQVKGGGGQVKQIDSIMVLLEDESEEQAKDAVNHWLSLRSLNDSVLMKAQTTT